MADQLTPAILLAGGVVVDAVGSALLVWGVRMLRTRRRDEAGGRRTTGRVVENRVEVDMENSRRVTPVVEFAGDDGRTHRFEGLWSTQEEHAIGKEVPVWFDPRHPERAGLVGEGRLGPILLLAFAAGALGLGMILMAAGALGLR